MTIMKNPVASKINWIGLAIIILTFLQDPKFLDYIPKEVGLWIFRIAGLLIIIVRTIWTQVACMAPDQNQDPVMADIPTDVVMPQVEDNKYTGKVEP